MTFCENCGTSLNTGANFCSKCGHAVTAAANDVNQASYTQQNYTQTAYTQTQNDQVSDTAKTIATAAGTAAGVSLLSNLFRVRHRRPRTTLLGSLMGAPRPTYRHPRPPMGPGMGGRGPGMGGPGMGGPGMGGHGPGMGGPGMGGPGGRGPR